MKDKFSLFYKIIFSIILITGITMRLGIWQGRFYSHIFFSFTNLSNLLVFFVTCFTAVKITQALNKKQSFSSSQYLAQIRVLTVLTILITGIIYHFLLVPEKMTENPNYTIFTYSNIVCHYLAPIGMTLDWLLFDKKGKINKYDPFKWCLVPIGYFLFSMIYGSLGNIIPGKTSSYPYFFLDVNQLGVLGVLIWCFFILLGILILFYSFYLLDHLLAKKEKKISY